MSLLLLPLAAQAGTYAPVFTNAPVTLYSLPTFYSGGNCTVNGVSSPYTASSSSAYGCARLTLFQPASMQCGGAITATWQWMPANASDLPPQNVILVQTSSVWATSGDSYSYGGSAICADGLGGTFVPDNPAYPNAGGSAQSTRYSVVAGGWTVTAPPCAPSGSASDMNFFATNMVSVSYSAQVYPITLSSPNPSIHPETGNDLHRQNNQFVYGATQIFSPAPFNPHGVTDSSGYLAIPVTLAISGASYNVLQSLLPHLQVSITPQIPNIMPYKYMNQNKLNYPRWRLLRNYSELRTFNDADGLT